MRGKKNLRVLRVGDRLPSRRTFDYKNISGGMLVQTRDMHRLSSEALKVVTRRAPTEEEIRALLFAWTVCKHTKSNAIVYAREGQTVGVGAGQMSRVDSVRIGATRAQLPVHRLRARLRRVFSFPRRHRRGRTTRHHRRHPARRLRPRQEVIAAADEHNLAMVFTGVRHFKH